MNKVILLILTGMFSDCTAEDSLSHKTISVGEKSYSCVLAHNSTHHIHHDRLDLIIELVNELAEE